MKARDISEASNPDLRASMAAMQRAAQLARKIAIQTDTGIVIRKDGVLTYISAAELREEAEHQGATSVPHVVGQKTD